MKRDSFKAPIERPDGQAGSSKRDIAPSFTPLQYHRLSPKYARSANLVLVAPDRRVFARHMPDARDRHLRRQSSCSGRFVGEFLQPYRIGDLAVIKGDPADPIAGIRPGVNSFLRLLVRQIQLQFDCPDNSTHIGNYIIMPEIYRRFRQSGGRAFPRSAKADGPLCA